MVDGAAPLTRRPEKINPRLNAPDQCCGSDDRPPDCLPQMGSSFFHGFHGARQNMIDVYQLHAQPFESLAQDSIDLLRLAPRHSRNFGSVRNNASDARRDIIDQDLNPRNERRHLAE